jgi:hypothetical protein
MASAEQILGELARRTAVRPCPEIVWQKKKCCNPEYQRVDERHTGEEFAIVSGSETFGVGSGAGVKYTTDFIPVALGTMIAKVYIGADLVKRTWPVLEKWTLPIQLQKKRSLVQFFKPLSTTPQAKSLLNGIEAASSVTDM